MSILTAENSKQRLINFRLARIDWVRQFLAGKLTDGSNFNISTILSFVKKSNDIIDSFSVASPDVKSAMQGDLSLMVAEWRNFVASAEDAFVYPLREVLISAVDNMQANVDAMFDFDNMIRDADDPTNT